MKRILFFAVLVMGCDNGSRFANEVDEYRYLSNLNTLTIEQYNRKKEIAAHDAPEPFASGTVEETAKKLDAINAL